MTKLRKVAFIIPSLESQASVTYPLSLYGDFISNGYECDLYYFKDKPGQLSFPEARKISLATQIPWHQYSTVNTHGLIPDLYAFTRKPLIWQGKLISTLHGFFYSHFKEKMTALGASLLSFFWMCILWRHDCYVVFTEYAKTQFPLLRHKKMRVIRSGITPFTPAQIPYEDIALLRSLKTKDKYLLGAVCRIIATKGLDQLVPLLKAAPQLHLVLVGSGPYRNTLEKMVEKFAVHEQITFLGFRPNGRNYIPYFDAFVMPSREEAFGLTLLESACVGTPIVCSRIPTFLEIFESDEVSFFDLDNNKSLLAAIHETRISGQQKAAASRKAFLKKYTLREMVKNYALLFLA